MSDLVSQLEDLLKAAAVQNNPDIGFVVGVVSPDMPDGVLSCTPASIPLQGGGSSPVNGNMMFELGSVSKVFTAGMVEAVNNDFSGRLADHVPGRIGDLLGWVGAITIEDIAVSASGLPSDNGQCPNQNPLPWTMTQTLKELISYLGTTYPGGDVFSSWPPSEWYTYSNLSWDLLGLTVANGYDGTDGQQFCENYQQVLTQYCTAFAPSTAANPAVTAYWCLGENQIAELPKGHPGTAPPVSRAQTADGGLVSTGDNMLAFLKYCMSPAYPTVMQTALHHGKNICDGTTSTGYGWFVNDDLDKGVPCVWKDGAVVGFTSVVILEPRPSTTEACPSGVVVMSNGLNAVDLGIEVFNIVKTADGPVPDLHRASYGFRIRVCRSWTT